VFGFLARLFGGQKDDSPSPEGDLERDARRAAAPRPGIKPQLPPD